jgi:hypothetical protein
LNTDKLQEKRYDLITAFNTTAHVPDVRLAISELRPALKLEGLLVF